jgi:protein-tyrosine-phosphatase
MGRHQARRVSRADIDKATMVITADRQTSAEIVRIDPAVRSKLFTMREAAVLSSRVVDAVRLPTNGVKNHGVELRPLDRPAVPAAALHWLVGEMDAARGQVSLLTERRRRRLFGSERVTVYDVDIRDAHVKSSHANHRHVVAEVTSAVTQTMDGVGYVLGLSVG